jgi:hypothetical protein
MILARPEKIPAVQWQVIPLPVQSIQPSPYQPRLSFDAEEMADLIASVRANGVQQPIIVRTAKATVNAKADAKAKLDDTAEGKVKNPTASGGL